MPPPGPQRTPRWFSALDYRATIATTPPPGSRSWDRLQEMRRDCRAVGVYRWPPHCNLVYPSVPPRLVARGADVLELAEIAAAIAAQPPFEVRLRTLDAFVPRRSVTLIICPETRLLARPGAGAAEWAPFLSAQNACAAIHAAVARASPPLFERSPRAFVPHVSVARFATEQIAREWLAHMERGLAHGPIAFRCDRVALLARRRADPFHGVWDVPLRGGGAVAPAAADSFLPSSLPVHRHPALHELFPDEYWPPPTRRTSKWPEQVYGRPLPGRRDCAPRRRRRPWYR